MSLPVVRLIGSPGDQGREHGRRLARRIARNVEIYFYRFETEAKLTRDQVYERSGAYGRAVAASNVAYYEGMVGVAEGSGVPLDDVIALNVRYEILYYQFGITAMSDGCTSFAVSPRCSARSHLLMGQNWDWIPWVQGAVLHSDGPGGLEILAFTEAGVVGGKIGLNSSGLGLAINGMTTTTDDWSRLSTPFHVRCHEILRRERFEDAVAVVTGEERACSTNFLIAQPPDRAADLEAAPDAVRTLAWENGKIVHTNHFLDPAAIGIREPPIERLSSRTRIKRFTDLVRTESRLTMEDLARNLRDHDDAPQSVCRHGDSADPPEEQYVTVTSIVMDLDDRTLWITEGPPCENPYEVHRLTPRVD